MASKRDFDEEASSIAAGEEEKVPAKKGRLGDNKESNLGTDLPPEDADDVSHEPKQEVSEHQVVVSEKLSHRESDKSESVEEMVDNVEQSGNEEPNSETVDYREEDGNTEPSQEMEQNVKANQEVFESDQSRKNSDSGDSVRNLKANQEVFESDQSRQNSDSGDSVRNLKANQEEFVLVSDQSSQNSDSGESIRKFVGNCEFNVDSNEETAEIVNCNQEASKSDHTRVQVDSGDSNGEVVNLVPSPGSSFKSYNSIDAAIDRVVAFSAESNHEEQEVIDISSDSDGQDVDYRDHSKIAQDGTKKFSNRFIRILSLKSKGLTKNAVGKSLLKVKNMSVASSVVPNRSVVSPVQQSWSHSGPLTSFTPSAVAGYVSVVSVPKLGFGSGPPPALLPLLPNDTNAPKLQPQSRVPSSQPLPPTPVSKTASEAVTPGQVNNGSSVNYFIVVTPSASAPNNEKSFVQQRGAQVVQSTPMVVTPANDGSSIVGNISKGCLVKRLKECKFTGHGWTEEMRVQILKKGRPCPKLEIQTSLRTSEYYYKTVPWLTGSSELNKWFCWPCLLYCPTNPWSWDTRTFNRNITLATDRHEITNEHLEATVRMKTHEMDIKKSSNVPISQHHNDIVRRNRHFFKLLVEVVCTVKKKLDNMYTSHVDCVELINLISCYDGDLKDYLLEKSQSAKNGPADLVSSYVGGVLASIESHIRAEIKSELDRAPFVCLILEDASDVVDKSSLAVVVRYADENGDICERFVRFVELGYERTPAAIVPVFRNIVTELDCGQNLVGFTYGGTLVEPPQTAVFNELISSDYPTARFFHYKEHNLRKLICQALSHLKYTRGFFQCLSDLSDFFESTPNALKTFVTIDKDVYRDVSSPFVWDFSSGVIVTVKDHYASIVKFLMKIIAWPSDWTSEATVQAPYFLNFLRKVQNRFFIVLLAKIFLAVDALTKAMAKKIDVDEWKLLAKRATVNLFQIKNYAFDEIVELASSNSLTKESVSDLLSSSEIKSPVYKDTFNEMIDYVVTIICSRNKGAELSFISLDTVKSISENEEADCKQPVLDRLLANMKIDDFSKLKAQVLFFLNNKFFLNKSTSQAIRCINEFKLSDTLPDLQKFLQLLITVPVISADTLVKPKIKRVKTYVRGKTELNSVDALMWIEKEMIDKMQENHKFYEDVIDIFAKSYAVIDTMYSKPTQTST